MRFPIIDSTIFINYRVIDALINFFLRNILVTAAAAMSEHIIILAAFSHFPTFQATNIYKI